MENYTKGETREVEMEAAFEVDQDCVDMKVNAGSKIRNLMGYAMNKVKNPSVKRIVWNGSGKAVTKTVTCAEIMKRKIKGLHQINKLRNRRIEEIWEPNVEGLERLKVNRDIPAISILLSKESLDTTTPGYQAPGSFEEFWKSEVQPQKPTKRKHKKYYTKKDMDSAKNRNTETPKSLCQGKSREGNKDCVQ